MLFKKYVSHTLLFIIALQSQYSIAQTVITYTKLRDDEAGKKTLLTATTTRYNNDIKTVSGNNKKYLLEIYSDRYK